MARIALAFTAWTERWIPDAFIFALLATVVVVLAGLLWTPATLPQIIDAWGNGFWDLIPFTLADGAHHHHRARAGYVGANATGRSGPSLDGRERRAAPSPW